MQVPCAVAGSDPPRSCGNVNKHNILFVSVFLVEMREGLDEDLLHHMCLVSHQILVFVVSVGVHTEDLGSMSLLWMSFVRDVRLLWEDGATIARMVSSRYSRISGVAKPTRIGALERVMSPCKPVST